MMMLSAQGLRRAYKHGSKFRATDYTEAPASAITPARTIFSPMNATAVIYRKELK
jgi:hypothetical protein